jgi:glycosyltransferase involved in cell wall biosynthesis
MGHGLAVVVASHERPIRLRWLLNALEEQTVRDFEVVVAHDGGPDSETERLLREHPVVTRHVTFEGARGPAELRNAAWRASTAPFVAFTDDDCRPPETWVERALAAARDDAIVQGTTRPDPDEAGLLTAPHARTQWIDPPTAHAQTCNIVYPRGLLEREGGFDERGFGTCAAEDTDLAWRSGAPIVPAPDVLTFHCVEPMGLRGALRIAWRWRQLPKLVRRHPGLRRHMPLPVLWKRRHGLFLLALLTRHPLAVLAWAVDALPSYGASPRGVVRAATELPGQAAVDAVEVAGLALGSVKHRTLFL